jgi:hypothetical protein
MTSIRADRRDRRRIFRFLARGTALAALSAALPAVARVAPARAAPEETVFELAIEKRKVVGASRTIRVKQNEAVVLRWRTDEAVTLHLHGYEIERTVEPGQVVEMRFEARASGRFAVEAHAFGDHARGEARKGGRHANLLYVEVHPR